MRRCRTCRTHKPNGEFAGPTARACNECRQRKQLRRCGRCKRRLPHSEFAAPRTCRDCATAPPAPRACSRCHETRPAADFVFRGNVCAACRSSDHSRPRACLRCHETKPADAFDRGPSGRRHLGVCRACLAAEADAKRLRRERRQATWKTADGYVRRCYRCRQIKPIPDGFYRIHAHINGLSAYAYECRACQIERVVRRDREIRRDPECAAARRASKARQQRQWRERNQQRSRDIQRAYRQRVMADPARRQQFLEAQRIAYRLRQERNGHGLPVIEGAASSWVYLPLAPVYERIVLPRLAVHLRGAIGAIARDQTQRLHRLPDMTDRAALQEAIDIAASLGFPSVGPVADELGVSPRTINAWVRGARPTLRSSVVEEILLRVDMFWWDVVSPGDDAYASYRCVFEGDDTLGAAA